MNRQNFETILRAFARRRPFIPFFLELVTGERILITHPEAVFPDGEIIVYTTPGKLKYRVFDSDSVCQLMDQLDNP
jgi:hypothetical protein